MYISVFCYKCASGEAYLSYLRPIKLYGVKWELSSVPAIQCIHHRDQELTVHIGDTVLNTTGTKYYTLQALNKILNACNI